MDELLVQQRGFMSSIERALPNFKKLGWAKLTPAVVQQRMALLKASFAQCETIHAKILAASTPETQAKEKYFTEQQFASCEESFLEALDYMAERQQLVIPDAASFTGPSGTSSTSGNTSKAVPLLPRISLPKFSGKFTEWETFRDHFRSVVIENAELADFSRMHYLLSCLKGEALDLIRALPITDANFSVAWKILLSRYDNKRRLVHEHIHVLNTLASVNSESASEIAALHDKALMAIQALRNLGRSVDQCGDFLVYLVSQRLDKATRKAWELHLGKSAEYPTFARLEEFLAARICALENILPVTRNKRANAVVQSHSTSTLKCPVCQQSHALSSCNEFKSKPVAQRRELANELRWCFNCLSGKHVRAKCSSQGSCRICHKKHHSLLHEESKLSSTETDNPPASESKQSESGQVTSHLLSNKRFLKTGVLFAIRVAKLVIKKLINHKSILNY